MTLPDMTLPDSDRRLADAAPLSPARVLNPGRLPLPEAIRPDVPVLVVLAAGKGTRFGTLPKCVQAVGGRPLARHSIEAFRRCVPGGPVIALVHYRQADVMAALGDDILYIHSLDPSGGTALAAYEAFCVPGLAERNPPLVLTMGDRIVPESTFRRLLEAHGAADGGAPRLALLTARYTPPRQAGKGRILRDARGRIVRILEQRDIDAWPDPVQRRLWHDIAEANCPLYAVRAEPLRRVLGGLTRANAQRQYYLTDAVEAIARVGGEVRALTTTPADPDYDLLCSDVTRPADLALLEGVFREAALQDERQRDEVEQAARRLCRDRPAGQLAAIARQLGELLEMAERERLGFVPDQPAAVAVAGGRLRIAFMHPDMGRFQGPAWQMPTGAADADGREQIVVLLQGADDGAIHLFPADAEYRERLSALPADDASMYPGAEVSDWYTYEEFGSRMAERLLLALGYFSDGELRARREQGLPLPPPALWVAHGMRRPFSLIGNAIASIRTLRDGALGARVQARLGRGAFRGLRLASSGSIPRGGFSSSSAVTVAVKNAINALYQLGIPPDLLVHLACQAEFGTGVRAGTLDQATVQNGRAGQGALISSNPRDNYRVLGVYPVPTDRFQVIFPYSVDRDREAWKWSGGMYGETAAGLLPTPAEIRKLTGKAAEIATLLLRLPLETDFFPRLEPELLRDGRVGPETARWVADLLRRLPLRIPRAALEERLRGCRPWLIEQFRRAQSLPEPEAARKADATVGALMAGWREPRLRRPAPGGGVAVEDGVPLRAMVAYLFGEVAVNFRLIREPDRWIAAVAQSQAGDRCFEIAPESLPGPDAMLGDHDWDAGTAGPARLDAWLERAGAAPTDFNRGLDDDALARDPPPPLEQFGRGNFFRGLALIDLADAMLRRAFGPQAVAARVNAAGQGDYFQVHLDTRRVAAETVQAFLRRAFYHRFGLDPRPAFVQPHPGGGAAAVRLSRYDRLPDLARRLLDRGAERPG